MDHSAGALPIELLFPSWCLERPRIKSGKCASMMAKVEGEQANRQKLDKVVKA